MCGTGQGVSKDDVWFGFPVAAGCRFRASFRYTLRMKLAPARIAETEEFTSVLCAKILDCRIWSSGSKTAAVARFC